jgi:DNA-binding NarL/FixJ family response regulator
MASSKAFVLTNKSTDIGQTRHSSFTHFLDLIDACGFDISVGHQRPELQGLLVYKLLFIDYSFAPINELLALGVFSSHYKNHIVLFDVNHEHAHVEAEALKLGARGVFYENDKLENMIKGIQQIKDGKYWFKRDTLEIALMQFMADTNHNPTDTFAKTERTLCLTKREQMLVVLIAKGAQNKEIAEQLNISVNTVKTHIYSIFRKTNCRNRVELIKWSAEIAVEA